MKYILRLKKEPEMAVDASLIVPENICGKDTNHILDLKLVQGNKEKTIADYFSIDSEQSIDDIVEIFGDLSRFNCIGQSMSSGEIIVRGSAGNNIANRMMGGKITIEGNVGSYCGANMADGEIIILGNATNYLGAAFPGYKRGMKGGKISVKNTGADAGAHMTGGEIEILESSGNFTGINMADGKIRVKNAGFGLGANMTEGEITCEQTNLLPTFVKSGDAFMGDLTAGGRGTIKIEKNQL